MGMYITAAIHWSWGGQSGDLRVFVSAVDEFLERIKDKTQLWNNIARNVLEPAVARNFESEGGELLTNWEKLADSTIKKRKRLGYGSGPILRNEGLLESSFGEGEAGHIEDITVDSMEWGSEVEDDRSHGYARYHQSGTDLMPMRQIVFWNERMRLETKAEITNFVLESAKGIFETSETTP